MDVALAGPGSDMLTVGQLFGGRRNDVDEPGDLVGVLRAAVHADRPPWRSGTFEDVAMMRKVLQRAPRGRR
jgi:hypothetical protein